MFVHDSSTVVPSFLPTGVRDTSSFMDITTIGSSFKVYLDTKTGDIHDGNKYYEDYLRTNHAR